MNVTMNPLTGAVSGGSTETMLAELARAASRVSERHRSHGAFVDIVLDLWQAQQSRQQPSTPIRR